MVLKWDAGGVRPGLLEPCCRVALATPVAPALSTRAERLRFAGGRQGPGSASSAGKAALRRADGAGAGRRLHRLGRDP